MELGSLGAVGFGLRLFEARPVSSVVERTVANDGAYMESKDSVLCALTDFRREHLIAVEADSSIGEALDDMNRLGVHALLVTLQEVGSFEQQVMVPDAGMRACNSRSVKANSPALL